LGLTLGCARCHEHKYDPFAQQEFYRLFAFFNNVPEQGRAIKYGNSPPAVPSPTRGQQAELRDLDRKLGAAKLRWAEMQGDFQAAQAEWEKSLVEKPADPPRRVDWTVTRGLATRMDFDGAATAVGADGAEMKVEAQGAAPSFGQGKLSQSAQFDGSGHLALPDAGAFGFDDKFTLAAWIYCDEKPQGTILSRMVDVPRGDGYYLVLEAGKVQLNLVKRWLDDSLRVETENAVVEPLKWHHILATYDGTRYATGVKIFVDGRPQQFRVNLDELNQDFATKEPLRIAAGGGPAGLFRGRIDDVRLYRTVLSPDEAAFVATAESISELAQIPPSERTPAQAGKLAACFLEGFAPEPIAKAHRELMELRAARQRLVESFPTTMVMQELPEPRETFVLMRGQYDKPGERVDRGVPEVLNSLRADAPRNRLGLARWLVDPANPLTARVTVNRFWQMHFGVGLVKTAEDFGTQGDRPANQDLLDYLAWRFVESGWDVKAILREIVTSSTYRQSSRTSPQLARLDPDNRLFARGPRLRLSAEMVRDQALFASGLLIEEVGGPSVRPYQPPGLWEEVSGTSYKQGSGAELYRRSLYTFWKRTIAPPSMLTFDASGREFCVVRETRTNTPLQALALMNEVTYVEAARVLAQNLLRSNRKTPEERLNYVFQLATSRRPTAQELAVLTASLDRNLARFRQEPQAAAALIATGEYPVDRSLDAPELAAYTAVTGLILNLDEAITKE
ncbi:MAG: DUF1553 domain-containing protein, partial [Planctomycetia bacterium]|nr:DUF1553 domain-containing protein [Planctomycetia bacterium]